MNTPSISTSVKILATLLRLNHSASAGEVRSECRASIYPNTEYRALSRLTDQGYVAIDGYRDEHPFGRLYILTDKGRETADQAVKDMRALARR